MRALQINKMASRQDWNLIFKGKIFWRQAWKQFLKQITNSTCDYKLSKLEEIAYFDIFKW